MQIEIPEARTVGLGGLVGFALVMGWCLHDVALLFVCRELHEMPNLAVGFLAALGVGFAGGGLLAAVGRWRWMLLIVVAVVMCVPPIAERLQIVLPLSAALAPLPKAVYALGVAWCGVSEGRRSGRLSGYAAAAVASMFIGGALAGTLLLLRSLRFDELPSTATCTTASSSLSTKH